MAMAMGAIASKALYPDTCLLTNSITIAVLIKGQGKTGRKYNRDRTKIGKVGHYNLSCARLLNEILGALNYIF